MKEKKKTIYGLIGSVLLLILIVSTSYAYIKLEKQEKDVNVLGTDCIKLEMEEETDALNLTKAYPMTDENGAKTDPFIFKLRNDCGVGVNYEIHLRVEETENKMTAEDNIATKIDTYDKVVLSASNKIEKEGQEPEEYRINKEDLTLNPYETVEHNVRIWLDEDAGNETQNKTFKSRIVIEATQNQIVEKYYKEAILHGADPVLNNTEEETNLIQTASGEETTNNDTLVPVIIGDDGTVTKADVTQEWYDYETKRWANAVILVDNNQADTIQPGEEIQEDQIESYFVWIPKYRYKLFNLGKYDSVQETVQDKGPNTPIEIEFGLEDTKDEIDGECTTPMLDNGVQGASGSDGNCQVGDWMTHPAFLAFKNCKGMWVGKFEPSNAGDDTIQIKPNKKSWTNTTVNNSFVKSRDYNPNLYSHMMKNTEWGAIAYLTQSLNGMCSNRDSETVCNKVEINTNQNYMTGYAGDSTLYPNSQNASTTGNNTGIFDMSGGAWDQVASVMADQNNETPMMTQSGLSSENLNDKRYYDIYNYYTDKTHWNRRILGDATGELGPFSLSVNNESSYFNAKSSFVFPANPYFLRGGRYAFGSYAGTFAFTYYNGDANEHHGFRIVLTPTNEVK